MIIPGIYYWIFVVCFFIQFIFSSDWMMLGDDIVVFSLFPLIASIIVIFRRETTNKGILGKIIISIMIIRIIIKCIRSNYELIKKADA